MCVCVWNVQQRQQPNSKDANRTLHTLTLKVRVSTDILT